MAYGLLIHLISASSSLEPRTRSRIKDIQAAP
jgi:hypothetical protein